MTIQPPRNNSVWLQNFKSSVSLTSRLLLALTLAGASASVPTSTWAQPVPVKKMLTFPPLTQTEHTTITQLLALSRQEDLCQLPVRLKVTRASLTDVAARLRDQLPLIVTLWPGAVLSSVLPALSLLQYVTVWMPLPTLGFAAAL